MKLKRWLRNLSVSAPRVAVRSQLPWALRAAVLLIAASIAAASMLAVYRYARGIGGPDHATISRLDEATVQALPRTERLPRKLCSRKSVRVERATREGIALQMKTLEEDNARLRADLAFFESLLPAPAATRGVVIRSFRLQPDVDEETLRYRLLVQQSGRPDRDFVGAVVLKVNLQKDGSTSVLQLPDASLPEAGPAPLSCRQ
jgi:hypothetical protein